MIKKKLAIAVIVLFLSISVIPDVIGDNPSFGKTITVDDDGNADYTRIQDAIDNASDGDMVFVYSGTYYENIKIRSDSSLILHGEDKESTIIDASYYSDVINIEESATGINISGFTIKNSGEGFAGITISSHYNIIENNIFIDNNHGIKLHSSCGNHIWVNEIKDNDEDGIWLHCSYANNITGNMITGNGNNGIDLRFSSEHNNIARNVITDGNGKGILFHSCDYNTIEENTLTNNTSDAIYISDSSDNIINKNIVINNNDDGIVLSDSSFNTITENNITNNRYGICLSNRSNNIINNIIAKNVYGIIIHHGGNRNNISGNEILNNNYTGISLDRSHNHTIIGNNITNNRNGISLLVSSDNIIIGNKIINNSKGVQIKKAEDGRGSNNNQIFHNNFIDNGQNARDVCNNIWDNGWEGNYWGDYENRYPDAKKQWLKGVWDTPYEIDSGENQDRYPLIRSYSKSKTMTIELIKPHPYERISSRFPFLEKLFNLLFSERYLGRTIRCLEFDWHPAQEPYDIP